MLIPERARSVVEELTLHRTGRTLAIQLAGASPLSLPFLHPSLQLFAQLSRSAISFRDGHSIPGWNRKGKACVRDVGDSRTLRHPGEFTLNCGLRVGRGMQVAAPHKGFRQPRNQKDAYALAHLQDPISLMSTHYKFRAQFLFHL